jgi:hypothetical protein
MYPVLQRVHKVPEKILQLAKVVGIKLQFPAARKNPALQDMHEFPSTEYEAQAVLTDVETHVVV